jgi:hypothetical protein
VAYPKEIKRKNRASRKLTLGSMSSVFTDATSLNSCHFLSHERAEWLWRTLSVLTVDFSTNIMLL